MKAKPFQVFNYKHKFKIIKYSIGSRLINSVPKGLKHSYEFIRWLKSQNISFIKKNGLIQFDFPIEKTNYSFSIEETSSDSDVFKQIILEEEYKHVRELMLKHKIEVLNVIDGGANVGYTSIYLSHFYPDATILALEPNKNTFKRLTHNIDSNELKKNVSCIQKGLWSKDTYLKADYSFRDKQDWSFRLEETNNEAEKLFETISVESLIETHKWETIDLFKIDIEGGEKELFQNEDELKWLDKVKVFAIEIHDEFHCREDIEAILKKNNFTLFYSGELTIGINKSCLK
ncbi:FkbM family methyltransferase [Brumimicrobium glaciale]|uniref:FkbM family methyltransferase n=1 Tax=Brumimicrobium glaciale TaxID=200475 RepID=A0A4V1WFP5_9FLAO|nr:FkbM family methyltransferase [Brumimicrobium glaciale]RYM33916.1 FkbM family methyltransferase [Brumimicrobium glaciale]